ncbi:MAG: NAD-dependent malic enzyme [Deltaproteobacteria bacterium]|nr:NAD-dependent malic enzyme [Deltaproteobacteria bacterium]
MPASLVRTLRIKTRRTAGTLGLLTTAFGDVGVMVGEIVTARIGHTFSIRDFHAIFDDNNQLEAAIEAIKHLADSELVEVINDVKGVHHGGKIRTGSRVDLSSMYRMQTSYNPGTREMVELIDENPKLATRFTSVGRTVAIISDGNGLLGVGKVKSRAMLPILEAKAALLASHAGLNSLPLVLDVKSEDEFIETVTRLAPSCGAFLLDAIAAPRNLRIQEKLQTSLKVPVFDDDADAPAIVGLAAAINACRRIGKDIKKVKIGQIGLGTAGGAIAALIMKHTGNAVLGEDVHPEAISRHCYFGGKASSLEEIMGECDVIMANTGHGNVIPKAMVRKGQAIIALSQPHPEIEVDDATEAGAAFVADGKAVDKAVALPGVLLGALGVAARGINDEMLIAAALCIADAAVGNDLVPPATERELFPVVACAVAKAAVKSGLADLDQLEPIFFEEAIEDERQLPFFD